MRPTMVAAGSATEWNGSLAPDVPIVGDDIASHAVRAVRSNPLVLILFGDEVPAPVVEHADRLVVLDGMPLAIEHRTRPIIPVNALATARATAALARHVCGRTVGLALGAGAIRGLAHGGALAALPRARIACRRGRRLVDGARALPAGRDRR
jgi:hypothetical protein